jgi:hypothetical protein
LRETTLPVRQVGVSDSSTLDDGLEMTAFVMQGKRVFSCSSGSAGLANPSKHCYTEYAFD